MEKKFENVKKAIELNMLFLEEVYSLDFDLLSKDEKDYLLSELRLTIGRIGSILLKHDQRTKS